MLKLPQLLGDTRKCRAPSLLPLLVGEVKMAAASDPLSGASRADAVRDARNVRTDTRAR